MKNHIALRAFNAIKPQQLERHKTNGVLLRPDIETDKILRPPTIAMLTSRFNRLFSDLINPFRQSLCQVLVVDLANVIDNERLLNIAVEIA
ncbi:MAG: hypothetical protein ACLRM5_14465 [Escherichia coli]